jgi:divalent metal cation (Fe/Co/Zn/Cd) transporter
MCAGIGIGYSSLASAVEIGLLLHPPSDSLEAMASTDLPQSQTQIQTQAEVQSLVEGRSNEMNAAALSVLVASVVAKEALFRKTLACGQAANSAVM